MKYQLKCLKTEHLINDNYTLQYTENALLRAVYDQPFQLQEAEGVWKYLDWIPTSTSNEYVAGTTTYKAEALGEALGMSDLWVTFHGYWPEKGPCAQLAVSRIWRLFQPFSDCTTTDAPASFVPVLGTLRVGLHTFVDSLTCR